MENTAAGQIKADSRRGSVGSENSQTAKEFIDSQTRLEADAREALPYSFDSCTYDLGPLRQSLFACLTCNPPPSDSNDTSYTPAAVCYSCSIACHGEHILVELFNKRDFVCDCGTTRMPANALCTLREDPETKRKGVHSQKAAAGNKYNHNFRNRFCGCGEQYDPHQEKGTMFQCLGLGTVETGGCEAAPQTQTLGGGDAADEVEEEGLPLPPGFPDEDDFEHLICFKCIDSNPWLKRYAGTKGFLPPVYRDGGMKPESVVKDEAPQVKSEEISKEQDQNPKKRKAEDDENSVDPSAKRAKDGSPSKEQPSNLTKHNCCSTERALLPTSGPVESFSLFLLEDFQDQLCRCADCWKYLSDHRQLREEEVTYEPPLSEDGDANGAASTGTGSLLERGEAALSNIDRVRAIEGAMIYDHLRTKVKDFLKPFADTGRAVGAEDIKEYFEKLRGDTAGIRDAAQAVEKGGRDGGNGDGDSRREQNGEFKIPEYSFIANEK
ncbi:hypothetical protein N7470_005209 [Penicillium chermesinum]|nr:hypothetical protein N7470_005209 [Penicillium chermesinum]